MCVFVCKSQYLHECMSSVWKRHNTPLHFPPPHTPPPLERTNDSRDSTLSQLSWWVAAALAWAYVYNLIINTLPCPDRAASSLFRTKSNSQALNLATQWKQQARHERRGNLRVPVPVTQRALQLRGKCSLEVWNVGIQLAARWSRSWAQDEGFNNHVWLHHNSAVFT